MQVAKPSMAKKVAVPMQSTKALTVSSGTSRRTSCRNGAIVPQVVGSFPSGVERLYQHSVTRSPVCQRLGQEYIEERESK